MQENIKSGIYCIECIESNKKYIGQSVDINDRWRRHISELNNNIHDNDYLQNAWDKYGEKCFVFSVLEYCIENRLDEREVYYIEKYNTLNRDYGYNLKSGGQNGGSKYSDELKLKMSNSVKKSYDEKLRNKRKLDALSQWSNPEIKAKILGENNGMYGKTHSEETRKKISNANKGTISWRRNTTPVYCIELNKYYKDATDAGNELGCRSSNILNVCRGERKMCGGYHWIFANEINNREII